MNGRVEGGVGVVGGVLCSGVNSDKRGKEAGRPCTQEREPHLCDHPEGQGKRCHVLTSPLPLTTRRRWLGLGSPQPEQI